MTKIKEATKSGTTIKLENYNVQNEHDLYFIHAIETANRQGYKTVSEYFNGLLHHLREGQQVSKQDVVRLLIEQFKQRPIVSPEEQHELTAQLKQTNHIAACEGWKETEFTRELDALYVKGQLTPDEDRELFNLMYL